MSVQKAKVNLKISGNVLPFLVEGDSEPIYREAASLINERMASLQNQYGNRANAEQLQGVIAVEAVVDALKAHENYTKLRQSLDTTVDEYLSKF